MVSWGIAAACLAAAPLAAQEWPQFRGAGSGGISRSDRPFPVDVSPEKHVLWKAEVPPGHSSPVVWKDRIYLTGRRDAELLTIALDRATGKVLWESPAPYETLENIHRTGSHAQSSPAVDGDLVVSYFGSSGLSAYDTNGKLRWRVRLGPFKNDFGSGSSPILVGDLVVLVQDHDVGSFIAAYDKATGKQVWRVERSEFLRSYATPVLWEHSGRKEVVVAGTLRIVGYDLATGAENWTVGGVSRIVNMTPVVGPDSTLYAACFSPGGEGPDQTPPPPVDELFASDADKDGAIVESEFPDNQYKRRFSQIDRNKDGRISRDEYTAVRKALVDGRNVVLAIKPGGFGDVTKSHVKWEFTKQIPYCPSPLLHDGVLYMVKNGGILTTLDAATGKPLKQGRLRATGDYYASPVAADGKIYLLSEAGELTVLSAGPEWKEIHRVAFDGDGHGTPALADGKIYARIGTTLYAFGLPEEPKK